MKWLRRPGETSFGRRADKDGRAAKVRVTITIDIIAMITMIMIIVIITMIISHNDLDHSDHHDVDI